MPSTEAYQVRPGTDADIPAVIELMRVSLGEGKIPRTREFWEWKHRLNPFGSSPMWVASAAGALIGVRLFMRWRFQWSGGRQQVAAVRAVDTSTHPDWQGKGIFKRLTLGLVDELGQTDVGFVFNTPNEKSRPGYLKMGWQQVGRVSLWIRPCRPFRLLQQALSATTEHPDQDEPVTLGTPAEGAEALLDEAAAAELFRRAAARSSGYSTPLGPSYLRWRYLACPAARYALSSLDPRRTLVAHRQRARRGLQELTITELVVEPSAAGIRAAAASLQAALREARPDYAAVALRGDAPQAAALLASGFVPAPRLGPILTVRPLTAQLGAPPLSSRSSFQTSIGDLELF